MQPSKKNYKSFNKQNKKKKEVVERETGELVKFNNHKRNPIVSLPEIPTVHIMQTYRRFVNNGGAVSGTISITDLLNQFMVAVTTVLAYPYITAIRIKKIRCLSPVQTQGTSVLLSMQPVAPDTGSNNFSCVPELYIDTSASIDIPAYIALTPSLMTPFGSWHFANTKNSNLLTIVAPQGSTMDILFEYILASNATQSSYTRTVAAATAGVLYAANILTNFVPQGVNTI